MIRAKDLYPLEKLLELWADELIDTEQVIEHLLYHLIALERQIKALQEEVKRMQ